MVYVAIALVALLAFCSLAVDWGRVQAAKSSLQGAVDAAARAGVAALGGGTTAARNAAISWAAYNSVEGQSVVLQSGDVLVGKWNATTRVLDTTSPLPDAVQVTARRTKARGNAIPLMFARVLGLTQADIQTTATARTSASLPFGVTGFTSIGVGRNLFVASYSSALTTSPSRTVYRTNGRLGSNGLVGLGAFGSSNYIQGNVDLGPLGVVDSHITVNGSINSSATALSLAPPVITPFANPYGIPTVAVWTGGGTISLPGGSYYFTSVTVGNDTNVSFTGPATVYIDGNLTLNDRNHIDSYNGIPSNLVLYQSAGRTITFNDDCSLTATIVAPNSIFTARDRFVFKGGMTTLASLFRDDCSIYCDEALATTGKILLVK